MMESTNVTRSLKRLAELETINEKQSEHISEQGKRIAELEEQANHREDTISFVRENLRATEAGIVDLENMLNRETATSGRWFAWHVAAAEEENEVIEKLEEELVKLRDYAGHTPGCPGMDRERHPERGCSCGWVQTEAALAKGDEKC